MTAVLLLFLTFGLGLAVAQDAANDDATNDAANGDASNAQVTVPSDMSIAFVDSQAAIAAHPSGSEAERLEQQASEEIGELREQLEGLSQRARQGEQLTPEENEQYQALLTTLEAVQQRYQSDIQDAAQPAIEAVNEVIRELAADNEIDVVLDIGAASEGLVVYARDGLDLTPRVLEIIRDRFPDQ